MALTCKPGLSCMETLQNYSNASGRFKWYRMNVKQCLFALASGAAIPRKPMMHRFHPIRVYFCFSISPTLTMMLLGRPIMHSCLTGSENGQSPPGHFPQDTFFPDRFLLETFPRTLSPGQIPPGHYPSSFK